MPHRRKSGPDTIAKLIPLALILLAFGLQLGYLAELQAAFPGRLTAAPFCGVDAQAHLERANGLLSGYLPGNDTFYFIPLYPLYLATLIKFFGSSLLLPLYLQVLLQLPGLAALYGIGRLTFSRLTGLLALLGMVTYNYYIFYVACFDQVLLTIPFLTLAIFFLLMYHRRLTSGWLWPAGICLAVTALSRPTILVVFPAIILWLYLVRRNRPPAERSQAGSFLATSSAKRFLWLFGRDVIFLVLPFIVIVSPITWHNYRVSGRFILLSDNFAVNFFTGNNPDATGLDSLAHAQSQPAVLRFIETNARVGTGETTLTAEALRYITQQPWGWLALTATKTWLWFGEADEPLVSPYFPLTVQQARTLARLPVEWQAAALVALLGLLLVPRDRCVRPQLGLLWLIYSVFSLGTVAFFIQLRFRLPLVPFVMLMAAALLALAPDWRRQRSGRYWAALLVLLLCYPFVPGLWIFILIFAGLGLGPEPFRRRSKIEPGYHPHLLMITAAIGLYLIVGGVWLRAEALSSDVSQRIDHYLGPPLVGNAVLGQTFEMDCDGLNQIEVTLGTFSHQGHDQPVTFYLATDPSAQEILFSQTFAGALVRDYRRQAFSFPPILDSAGRTFFFFMASPASTPTHAITARGYTDKPVDRYPGGSAYAGEPGHLQRLEADFAFGAYCDLSWGQRLSAVLADPFGRTAQGDDQR